MCYEICPLFIFFVQKVFIPLCDSLAMAVSFENASIHSPNIRQSPGLHVIHPTYNLGQRRKI